MKSLITIFTFALLLTVFSASASAQVQSNTRIIVQIPFQFSVGDKQFEPGEYSVWRVYDSGLCYSIRRTDTKQATAKTIATFTVTDVRGNSKDFQPKLVFDVKDEQYQLAQVWGAGGAIGVELSGATTRRSKENNANKVILIARRDK